MEKLQYERKRVLCELCVHMCVHVSASKKEGCVCMCFVTEYYCVWVCICGRVCKCVRERGKDLKDGDSK